MRNPEIVAEQEHVDRAYVRLDVMRSTVAKMVEDAMAERGGTFQSFTERDIRVRSGLSRLEHLQLGDEALVFGRIDRRPEASGEGLESYHIGRLAIADADLDPLVVDWRAPVAEPFYRATGAHPMGLRRRRHLLMEGRQVVDLEDELFASGEALSTDPATAPITEAGIDLELAATLGLSGPQVLLSALSRSRTGRMRDIVATVQREQDEIIRAPLPGVLVVQGGPGTGKTAVALHRAAYLLYTHRFPLERQGLLVVGPNPTFLRYIEHVLPSLGESGVELSTISALYSRAAPVGEEGPEIARLKGDVRMSSVLAKAVRDRQRALPRTIEVPFGGTVLLITRAISSTAVQFARRRSGPHNQRRRLVESALFEELSRQLNTYLDRGSRHAAGEDDLQEAGTAGIDSDGSADGGRMSISDLGRELRRLPEVATALDRMWPLLTPEQLLHDLYGARPLLQLGGSGLLSAEEIELLWRPRSPEVAEVAWSTADIALLDEAREILGPPRRRRARAAGQDEGASSVQPGAEEGETTMYGHIVVDEAQDLSPMQLRMLARRSLSGSMTIVGDLAQVTGSWAPASWSEVVAHLRARRGFSQTELTVNYRTPREIMELAATVLAAGAPAVRAPAAVRSSGNEPRLVPAAGDELAASVVAVAAEEMAEVSDQRVGAPEGAAGIVGVISPLAHLALIVECLEERGISVGTAGRKALDAPISVLTVEQAKGLEFDSVVVVEPAEIIARSPRGVHALYVALTRATQRLAVVHSQPLPVGLVVPTSPS